MSWKTLCRDDRIEAIRAAFESASHRSGSGIADEVSRGLNEPISKNIIMGYVRRHQRLMPEVHLSGEYPGSLTAHRKTVGAQKPLAAVSVAKAPKIAPAVKFEPRETVFADDAPVREYKTLMELRDTECHYIVSGGGASSMFCAMETTDVKSSWCGFHAKRVFTPTIVRLR